MNTAQDVEKSSLPPRSERDKLALERMKISVALKYPGTARAEHSVGVGTSPIEAAPEQDP